MASASNDEDKVSNIICDVLNISGNAEVKIALVGETKSGKSSFIKAVDERYVDDKKGPPKATTSAPDQREYSHPQNENIKLVDLPGHSTEAYPDITTYWQSLDLRKYHAYLLFTTTRLTIDDVRLATRIKKEGKPYYVIRTFIDEDIENERGSKKSAFNEADMVNEIRENIKEIFRDIKSACEQDIFLISNIETDKWDFEWLNNEILHELRVTSLQPIPWTKKWCPSGNSVAITQLKLLMQEKMENVKYNKKKFLKELKNTLAKENVTMKDYGVLAAQKMMQDELNHWQETEINLAITGDAGVGKSSFINALTRKAIARVGVTETTKDCSPYPHPSNSKITLWDLPGIGTTSFSGLKSYCDKIKIGQYDVFIIMTAGRFTDNAGHLAEKIYSLNKPYLFVRTKIDHDITNEKREKRENFNEVRMREKIKEECSEKLRERNKEFDDNNIFLISNHFPYQWDFPRLTETVNEGLPVAKKLCFIFSLEVLSKNILKEKIKTLKGRVWMSAWLSIIRNKVTMESYWRKKDCKVIAENLQFYRSQLGFPQTERSSEFQMMSEELQASARDFYRTSEDDVETWLTRIKGEGGQEGLPSWLDIDKAIREPRSFVKFTLNGVLNKIEKTASDILEEAATREKAKIDMKNDN